MTRGLRGLLAQHTGSIVKHQTSPKTSRPRQPNAPASQSLRVLKVSVADSGKVYGQEGEGLKGLGSSTHLYQGLVVQKVANSLWLMTVA